MRHQQCPRASSSVGQRSYLQLLTFQPPPCFMMQSSGNLVSTERVAGIYFKYTHFPSTQSKPLPLASSFEILFGSLSPSSSSLFFPCLFLFRLLYFLFLFLFRLFLLLLFLFLHFFFLFLPSFFPPFSYFSPPSPLPPSLFLVMRVKGCKLVRSFQRRKHSGRIHPSQNTLGAP